LVTPQESLEELARLADTAGLRVMGSSIQMLDAPNNATFVNAGKVAEVAEAVRALQARLRELAVVHACSLSKPAGLLPP
jgi:GTP-binding protein HflX